MTWWHREFTDFHATLPSLSSCHEHLWGLWCGAWKNIAKQQIGCNTLLGKITGFKDDGNHHWVFNSHGNYTVRYITYLCSECADRHDYITKILLSLRNISILLRQDQIAISMSYRSRKCLGNSGEIDDHKHPVPSALKN